MAIMLADHERVCTEYVVHFFNWFPNMHFLIAAPSQSMLKGDFRNPTVGPFAALTLHWYSSKSYGSQLHHSIEIFMEFNSCV
jgi:hypothetical protein